MSIFFKINIYFEDGSDVFLTFNGLHGDIGLSQNMFLHIQFNFLEFILNFIKLLQPV
jgi:hypothetical protein